MKNLFRRSALCLLLLFSAATRLYAEEPLSDRPIDPGQLTRVAFGSYSHWLQPWRGYLETTPATRFLDGIGIVLNTHRGEDNEQILRMFAKCGFKHVRVEIPWGAVNFDDETRLNNAADAAARLRACRDDDERR